MISRIMALLGFQIWRRDMRHTLKYAAAGAAMFLAAGQAAAADIIEEAAPGCNCFGGPYISLFAGAAFDAQDPEGSYGGSYTYTFDTETGFLVGGAIGAHITPNFRGEIELSFKSHDIDGAEDSDGDSVTGVSGDVDIFFILANFWYDFDMGAFTPYLGGGVGVAKVNADLTFYDSYEWDMDNWTLAGQVGAGIKWMFTDNFGLDLGYRLKATSAQDFQLGDNASYNITGVSFVEHVVQLGLTFDF
jgi:opacity protein-like surface antigen